MGQAMAGVMAGGVLVVVLVLGRSARSRRHAGARTVALRITSELIERELADGRRESVRVRAVERIEVVVTTVPTADGARAFALLGEASVDPPVGCLVPLGVGWDDALLDVVSRLPGFDLRTWSAARERRAPARTTVWGSDPAVGRTA